ncbi:SapC family protein [Alteromonadaceae bacterium BrNp21-10]|nr:SapC family protein [Alteromonadaceae bacterium BrNp21-10]
MKKAIVLNNVDHKDLKVDTRPSQHYGDNVNRTVAHTPEIGELHKEFPILFYKNPENQQLQMHVIMGLEKDENLFLHNNQWTSRYVPAVLARGPFSIGYRKVDDQGEEQQEPVICIDMDDPRVNADNAESVFLQFGGESPYLTYVKKALQTIESGAQFDKTLFTLAESMDLLEPVSIQIQLSNVEQINFSDYYTINQEKLSKLDGESLAKLNQFGVLSLLHFLLSSLGNFQRLIDLKNAKSALL